MKSRRASGLTTAQTSAQFDLSLSLAESEEGIVGSLIYATALFEHATLERWIGHWRHLLAAMVAEGAEDRAVDRLPLLDEAERHQLLTQWNATKADYPGAEDRAVDRLPLLDEAERHQLLTQWNATKADYPRARCLCACIVRGTGGA
ncbi:condensation domain-containing protein [Xanthomonas sp. MUS 060]|uniref:condensation domain-containing protein n=1 Tax=Xanthomonas sp. MUS 060 TaxID=1588031 RepID=UPI00126A0667|nr:condensation domain-containing protein [Xanthomonas sp. MUS 060]